MADIKIDMVLADGGSINKKTGETKALNGELTKTQRLARSAFAGSGGGAAMGGDAVAMQGYNQARGAAGTGAAGRDFANQAQGLGGLVRVYATFAANLYAVGAAFTALKNAADTTNLLKGLEQLGVASGVNLPKVAKDLADASGGAIALRDAMTATAQASSAGMTSENIKRMGDVARNASQAMGIDMTSALDRLSRGITKLEPELLDEIGIFTRTEQASVDYARALGKSVSSLTSFEKRQAFANAVLAEGEQKFGAIALQTNPYNQLLASLKDLSQAGLELINTVLGPLIKFLSQSPVALGAAMAAIAATLIKQAIPALAQWREQLSENVERTSAAAAQNLQYFKNYQQDIAKTAAQGVSDAVKTQADIAKTSWEGLQQQTRQSVLRNNKELRNIMKTDLESASQDQVQRLTRVRQQYERAASASYSDPARQQAAQARLAEFNKVEPEIRRAISAQLDYNRALDAATPTSLTIQGRLLQRIADNADIAEKKMRILANAADNAAFSGPIAAMTAMGRAVQRLPDSVGLASRAMLYLRGTVTITAVAIGTLTTAFGNLLGVIGIITGVGMLLSTIFSTNSDEAAKASKSIDDLKSAGDNLDRVLDSISKKTPLEQLSSQSISASATAMGDLTSAINQAIKDTDTSIAARSWWDSFTNGLASIIRKSDEQVLEKTITKQLNKILQSASSSIDAANIRKDYAKALGLGEGASDEDILKTFTADAKGATSVLQNIMDKFRVSAQSGKAFSDNLKELSKTFQDMTNELLPKGKLVDAVNQSNTAYSDLSKLLDGPVTVSLAAMNDLLNNSQALSMLPPDARQTLMAVIPEINNLTNSMANNQLIISNATIALQSYNKQLDNIANNEATTQNISFAERLSLGMGRTPDAISGAASRRSELQTAASVASTAISDAQLRVAKDTRLVESYKETFKTATEAGFKANAALIENMFRTAAEKARIQLEQKALSNLPETPAVIARQGDLQKRQIDLDTRAQIVQARLIITQEKTNAQLELLRLTIQKDILIRDAKTDAQIEARKPLIDAIDRRAANLTAREEALTQIETGRGPSRETVAKMGPEDASRIQQLYGSFSDIRSAGARRKEEIDLDASVRLLKNRFALASELYSNEIKKLDDRIKEAEPLAVAETDPERQRAARAQIDALAKERRGFETARELLKPSEQEAISRVSMTKTGLTEEEKRGVIAAATRTVDVINAQAQAEENVADINRIIRDSKETTQRYQEQLNADLEVGSIQLKLQADLAVLQENSKSQQLDYESQLLSLALENGSISKDSFNQQQRALQLKKIELDYEQKMADIRRGRTSAAADLAKDVMQATGPEGEWSSLTPAQQQVFAARASAIGTFYDAAAVATGRFKEQQLGIVSQQEVLLDRQQEYSKVFEGTFDKMADAIVDFAATGQNSFKGLINSMLADLLRYELRLQMSAMYKAIRPGLTNFIGNLFGASSGSGATAGSIGFGMPSGVALAKGGAFTDTGLMKYAKGGTFTNSIVDSPTMFKFAKGTGLMGEAGPEAIMPLKRDAQGNLGVRGGNGGNVEVVVNNYSTEKAEARETTDSRGNRRVEVIVGEMTGAEISRGGSMANRSIRNTFGLQPQLIRR